MDRLRCPRAATRSSDGRLSAGAWATAEAADHLSPVRSWARPPRLSPRSGGHCCRSGGVTRACERGHIVRLQALHQNLRNDSGWELIGETFVQPVTLIHEVAVVHSQQVEHGGVEIM